MDFTLRPHHGPPRSSESRMGWASSRTPSFLNWREESCLGQTEPWQPGCLAASWLTDVSAISSPTALRPVQPPHQILTVPSGPLTGPSAFGRAWRRAVCAAAWSPTEGWGVFTKFRQGGKNGRATYKCMHEFVAMSPGASRHTVASHTNNNHLGRST